MPTRYTPAGKALTGLILEIFRLNGRLLSAGDTLIGGLGLTSARWQVLGAITLSDGPQTVAGLARGMGLNRQGVQRVVDEMNGEGLVAFKSNPSHKRAHLVVLTEAGRDAYAAAMDLQIPWANVLAKGISATEIDSAVALVASLRARLAADG